MAIYKPTNCTPFLATFDCRIKEGDKPIFFECRIDSSNRNAVGYSVTVYNENNEQVFPPDGSTPDAHISNVSYLANFTGSGQNGNIPYLIQNSGYNRLNSGLNGTYLKFPFILDDSEVTSSNGFKSVNTIYCTYNKQSETYSLAWYDTLTANGNSYTLSGKHAVEMYNGNSYKWVITLYQGNDAGITPIPPAPEAYKYYDMQITAGEVMGSYDERIQTVYSENVYIDYYIEPVAINFTRYNSPADWSGEVVALDSAKNTRTRIKNIDSTYGYIYPQFDDYAYPKDTIKRGVAQGYRVYQMGNSPDVLTTTRIVNLAVGNKGVPFDWVDNLSDDTTSYGEIRIYAPADSSFSVTFGEGDTAIKYQIANISMSSTQICPFNLIALNSIKQNEGDTEGSYVDDPSEGKGVVRWFVRDGSYGINTDTRVLLNAQPEGDTAHYTSEPRQGGTRQYKAAIGDTSESIISSTKNGSMYNGIFTLRYGGSTSVPLKVFDGDGTSLEVRTFNEYLISFDRANDADSWGELMSKIVNVQGNGSYPGQNMQTQTWDEDGKPVYGTPASGTINESPIVFVEEQPVQLYNYENTQNKNINSVGIIFYNGGENITQPEENKLYISPFVGIKSGMYWIEQGNMSPNDKRRFLIKGLNEDYWYVTYDSYNGGNSTGTYPASFARPKRQTPYVIKSYFRDSDENPFNLYENPTIDIKVYRDENHTHPDESPTVPETDIPYFDSNGEYVAEQNYGASDAIKMTCVDRRIIWCEADYNQADFISWRSFQWFLYDGVGTSGTLLQSSDLTFDGKLGHQFYGLLLNKVYTVVLVLETNSGLTLSQQKYISTNFQTEEVDNFPFDITYECETHSVYLRFGLSGFILPNVYSESATKPRIQEEDGMDTFPAIEGVTYDGENMIIDGTDSGFPDTGVTYSYICSTLDDNMATNQIQADEDDVSFESSHRLVVGDRWGSIIGFDFTEDELDFGDGYESFNIFIPDYNSGSFEYNGETYSYVDETRVHQILFENTAGQIVLEAPIYDWRGSLISSKGIFDADEEGNTSSPIVVSGHFQTGGEVDEYNGDSVIFKENYPSILITMDEGETSTYFTPRNGAPHQYRESYFDFLGQDDAENVNALPPLVAAENVEWVDFLVLTTPGGSAREEFNVKDQTGGSEIFQVIGTGPYIWSDYNLARKNVAYSGSVSINAQTLEKTFNAATYVNRQVEDLESDWVWSDGTYTDSGDVSGGNYEPDFYWVDGDDGGQLDGLYSQTDLTTSSSASLRNSANIERYTYSIRAVVEGNYSGMPNITVQIFKQLLEGG